MMEEIRGDDRTSREARLRMIRQSPTYRAARARGVGVVDAAAQMRSAAAYRSAALSCLPRPGKRS